MKDIKIPFGDKELELKVPTTWNITIAEPKQKPINSKNELEIIKKSILNPINSTPLRERDLKDKKILIVVDDNTRPTPTQKFFHIILEELKKAGVKKNNILIMPALGIHTPMTHKEMEDKIGSEHIKHIKWKNPNAYDERENVVIGKTSLNIDISLNREVLNADFIVLIGMIEPHLWAGYGGGMKLLFPGLGSAKAIAEHHMIIAMPPYEVNRVGVNPESNSFRLQLEEVLKFINKELFLINVILDKKNNIVGCVSGHPIMAHREGINICKEISGIEIPSQGDGIIVSSHPMDINLKQGMKGVANSLPAVKKNGIIMAFLYAQKGIDDITLPDKSIPLPLLRLLLKIMGKKFMWSFVKKIKANKNPEEQFLTYYTLHLIKEYKLFVHAPTISPEETKKLGVFENFYNPYEVIKKGATLLKKDAHVIVFKEAGATYPIVNPNRGILDSKIAQVRVWK